MPKISIIIPVYKAEKYLRTCLDSILAQTFKDWEAILVDDGSPDGSGTILDDYAAKDPRFKVIHKENGGASAARNAGLDVAVGEWVAFIDADDYVDADYLESLYSVQQKYNADFVCCGQKKIRQDGSLKFERRYDEACYTEDQFEQMLVEGKLIYQKGPVIKLFSRSILNQYNIRFIKGAITGEDEIFMYTYFLHCKSVAFSQCTGYNYVVVEGSLTHQANVPYKNEQISYNAFEEISDQLYKRYPAYTWVMEHSTFYHDRLLNAIYREFKDKDERLSQLKSINLPKYLKWKRPATIYERFILKLLSWRMFSIYDKLRMIRP